MLQVFKTIASKELLPIVPVFNHTNKPSVPWKTDTNWIKDINDLEIQGEWFEYTNNNNEVKKNKITGGALITGKSSGIMVLDLDRNHGDGTKDGIEAYKKIVKDLGLSKDDEDKAFNTFTVKTPNGGLHLYFKYREGLKNDSNQDLSIDLRTDGGIIITPGSLRKIDDEIREYTVYKDNPIYDMPIKLFNKLTEYFGVNKVKVNKINEIDKKPGRPPKNKEYYTVINEGGRNNALTRYLGKMINHPMFRNIHELLPLANMYNQCYINPPLEQREVENTVNSMLANAKPVYCNDKGKIINGSLVKYVLDKSPSYVKGNMLY
ncbi:MAG: bifunctional DNA primase/polymerase, partial [Peptostreptococcaceae bacterium]|nr:bifunctional DNA primase/polymerase [Peptostreptococcaceae bacterium]